eukprot:334287-Prorocentrum_minimum.AAC.1
MQATLSASVSGVDNDRFSLLLPSHPCDVLALLLHVVPLHEGAVPARSVRRHRLSHRGRRDQASQSNLKLTPDS